ncbi:hypothetical protein QNI19_37045 [Cytophagaceae bacterium DM2B3-1]|uniref:Uncharacterized protein n=1 Tax=Xanthocytophaga flava TaxID=3048013 RepID=A0ABT7CXV1_9BACT|nr:hypothetical protein [Xanthocytophaga flavus]MDJ1498601.1 hypothetical protein [Xanthocytophaga flavus]
MSILFILFFLTIVAPSSVTDTSEAYLYRKAFDCIKKDSTTLRYLSQANPGGLHDSMYVANQKIKPSFDGIVCEYVQRNYKISKPEGIMVREDGHILRHVVDSLGKTIKKKYPKTPVKVNDIPNFYSDKEAGNILFFSEIENQAVFAELKYFDYSYTHK